MKLQLKIQQVAKRRGYDTAYKLQKAAELSPTNASRLFNHEVKQLSLETLGKLCKVLDCEVGDLIVRPKRGRSSRSPLLSASSACPFSVDHEEMNVMFPR